MLPDVVADNARLLPASAVVELFNLGVAGVEDVGRSGTSDQARCTTHTNNSGGAGDGERQQWWLGHSIPERFEIYTVWSLYVSNPGAECAGGGDNRSGKFDSKPWVEMQCLNQNGENKMTRVTHSDGVEFVTGPVNLGIARI